MFRCLPPGSQGAEPCSCHSCTWYAVSTPVNHHSLHERAHSVCVHFSVCDRSHQCKESTLSFIFMLSHILLQPSYVVYTSENVEHFFLQYPQISTSQGKDSKLTPVFSMKCWTLSHKLSSCFSVWSEQKTRVSSKTVSKDLFTDPSRL